MGVLEPFHVAESFYKPIVDVSPIQCHLHGLQQKDKVCYGKVPRYLNDTMEGSCTRLRLS